MNLRKLASLIAKREGKKSQARIGDIREILKILIQLEIEDILENPHSDDGPLFTLSYAASAGQIKAQAKLAKRKK